MFIFIIICAVLMFALGVSFVLPGFANDMNIGFYLAVLGILACFILIMILRNRMPFFKTLSIYICIFLSIFSLSECALIYFSSDSFLTGKEKAIIVPGSGLFVESRLTTELEKRLNLAIDIYSQNSELPIVLSGGVDQSRALPQCIAMKDYLETKVAEFGLPKPRILTDETSTTIYSSIKNSLTLADTDSAYIIVSRHNIPRTKIILNSISPHSAAVAADYPLSKYAIYYFYEFGQTLKTIFEII